MLVAAAFHAAPAAAASTDPASLTGADKLCRSVFAPVPLGTATSAVMHGRLCVPRVATDTIVVMVPGATYSGLYWNFPYRPDTFSQVNALLEAGYATYTIDRLGTGLSSRPSSDVVTVDAQAAGVHASIGRLRSGVAGKRFSSVVLMGHSLGSVISIVEASRYGDVDGLVVTGLVHDSDEVALGELFSVLYPATSDPKFADSGLDAGYFTTLPDTRGDQFHSPSDPVLLAVRADEKTKSVVALGEFADSGTASTQVTVPVLVAVGGEDAQMCGPNGTDCSSAATLAAAEAPFYPNAASVTGFVLPSAGHDLTLARNTDHYQSAVNAWIAHHL